MDTWAACSFSLAVRCCFEASAWVCLEIATIPATLCSKAFPWVLFSAFSDDSSSSFVIPLSRGGMVRPEVRCRWCEASGLPCKDSQAPRAGCGGPTQALVALGGDQWSPDGQSVPDTEGPGTHFAWHLVHIVRRPGQPVESKYPLARLNSILPSVSWMKCSVEYRKLQSLGQTKNGSPDSAQCGSAKSMSTPRRSFPGNCMQTAAAAPSHGSKGTNRNEQSEALPCISLQIHAGVSVVVHTAVTIQSHHCRCMIGRTRSNLSLA